MVWLNVGYANVSFITISFCEYSFEYRQHLIPNNFFNLFCLSSTRHALGVFVHSYSVGMMHKFMLIGLQIEIKLK